MKKDVIFGDEHCRGKFKKNYEKFRNDENVRFIICTGDYFDPYVHKSTEELISNFNEIIDIAKKDSRVKLLLGNHDVHYLIDTGERSRICSKSINEISTAFLENLGLFNICIELDKNTIVSHAGISPAWMSEYHYSDADDINSKFKYIINKIYSDDATLDPEKDGPIMSSFSYYPFDRSGWGDNKLQPPTWIRPSSLLSTSENWKWNTQIVGHTRTDVEGLSYYVDEWPADSEFGKVTRLPFKSVELIFVDTGDFIDEIFELPINETH